MRELDLWHLRDRSRAGKMGRQTDRTEAAQAGSIDQDPFVRDATLAGMLRDEASEGPDHVVLRVHVPSAVSRSLSSSTGSAKAIT